MGRPKKLETANNAITHQTSGSGEQPTTVSIRMEGELKTRLETAANEADRTLSQECMRRLRRSFAAEALFVDSVAAMEGGKGHHRKAAEYLLGMAAEVYGDRAAMAGLAMMRLAYGREIYGDNHVPNPPDMSLCRVVMETMENAVQRSKESDEQGAHSQEGRGLRNPDRRRS